MTYVIGDVHGNIYTLKKLESYFSKNDRIIFVGDLIDRGLTSRQTVKYVREKGYECVLGNHELMMTTYGRMFLNDFVKKEISDELFSWLSVGGKETLYSYGLIDIVNGNAVCSSNEEYLEDYISDINWMQTIPLYIELEEKINDKKVVISHTCISNVWNKKDDDNFKKQYLEHIIWDRQTPDEYSNIFNIFGHTKVKEAKLNDNYINIDTGCHSMNYMYGKLSAFCVDDQEVISINRDVKD